jgi:hypothetical protein
VTRRELPRGDMTIEGEPSAARGEESSKNDDVKDEMYAPSPRARPHGRGKGLASASGSEAVSDDEIEEEEEDDNDGDNGEEEETFDVEEINPTSYIHMGTPIFWLPMNPDWREKISYKGKIDLVREKRKKTRDLLRRNQALTTDFTRYFNRTSMSLSSFPRLSPWQFLNGLTRTTWRARVTRSLMRW